MNLDMGPFLHWCVMIAMATLFISFLLVIIRVIRGPTTADRVIAIDLFGVLAVAFIAGFTLYIRHVVFLDAAIALALVAFFGTVAYARFMERRVTEQPEENVAEGVTPVNPEREHEHG